MLHFEHVDDGFIMPEIVQSLLITPTAWLKEIIHLR